MATAKQHHETIEDLLIQIAEGDLNSSQELIDILGSYDNESIPENTKTLLTENLNMVMNDLDATAQKPVMQDLFLNLARLAIDSMYLRDALATISRQINSTYPDPSGLIQALGIFDSELSIKEVYKRWQVFSVLNEDSMVWHPSYGLGIVSEIDAFSDLVYITFKRKQHFNLVQSLTSLSVVKPNTTTASLNKDSDFSFQAMEPDELDQRISLDFVPPLEDPQLVTQSLLVPKRLNKKSYLLWRNGNSMQTSNKKKSAQDRSWNNARSFEELKSCLAKVKSISVNNNDIEHLNKLFGTQSVKLLPRFVFAEVISILWSHCPKAPWLVQLIKDLPENAVAWGSKEHFVEVTCKLRAKLVPDWLQISEIAKERMWLVPMITALPLRFWPSPKHPLANSDDFVDQLCSSVLEQLKAGEASPDSIVWIWRNQQQRAESCFSNPNLIIRVLNRTVKGEFQKSYKELYRLLLEDQDFQKVLMDNGSTQGIKTFIRIIKGNTLLKQGEQQSLLVKIVRIYPEAQEFVAKKNKVVLTRAIPKTTSVRSFEQRRHELEEIINVKIPKNSAAIAHARSYGDLRENAEFKAAKEQQRLLLSRRQELERDLKEIIPTDFSDVCVLETVIPGSSVDLIVDRQNKETYHLLGLWDSNPDENILSYDAPLGRLLIGKRVGESFTTPHKLNAEITAIKALPDEVREWVKLPENSLVSPI